MKRILSTILAMAVAVQLLLPTVRAQDTSADGVKAFLENPANVATSGHPVKAQISQESRYTKVSLYCDGEIHILKDLQIPAGVKLQIPKTTTKFHVDGTITVNGCIQDGRNPIDRANGLVGNGNGKVIFTNTSGYYQQGKAIIDTQNTVIKLANASSTVTVYKGSHLEISSGTVNVNGFLNSANFKKITVADGAVFNDNGNIGKDIEYTKVSHLDKDLASALKKAITLRESVSVSSDGSDICSDALWITAADKAAYNKVILSAQQIAQKANATPQDYSTAITTLQEATFRFHAAKKQGTKKVAVQETYQDLLDVLNGMAEGCATYKGSEDYMDQHYEVVQITKPVTIDKVITVPMPVKLQFNADVTINGRIIVAGYLQDLHLSAYGIIGQDGTGDVLFNSGTWMYAKGKGSVVGTTSGICVNPDSQMLLVGNHSMIVTKGSVNVLTSLYTGIAKQVYCMENTKFIVSKGISDTTSIDASNPGVSFIYRGIANNQATLGTIATTVTSKNPNTISASIDDGKIVITVLDKEYSGNAEIIFTGSNKETGTIALTYANGAITSAKISKVGALTANQAKEKIAALKAELKAKMAEAEAKGLDTEREKGVLWFSEYFEKCAAWDESHMPIVKEQYKQSTVYGADSDALAEELPMYERMQIIKMLENSLQKLQEVIDGSLVRPDVVLVDWDNLEIKGDQFYNPDGTPVFLYDYFSKAQNGDQNDSNLYNDYLGNILHPISQSLQYLSNENGELSSTAIEDNINFYKKMKQHNAGYQFLWHSGTVIPAWALEKYGNDLTIGAERYTAYDIDNPVIRNMWQDIFDKLIPQIKDSKSTQLGYILHNEPHWFSGNYYDNVNGISQYTSKKFQEWLKNTYTTIDALNRNWGSCYASFDAVNMQIPGDLEALRGTPKYYDWSRFNMDRVNEWFQFLHDNIKQHDPDALTHIKLFPRIIVGSDGTRNHGIDIEYLSSLTEVSGNDVTVRKALPNATVREWWEDSYSYDWRELAMTYGLLDSFGPNKLNINSESHFLSGNSYADMNTTTQYTRSVYWLSAILGNNMNMTWWWPRYGDGSIEPRLQTSKMGRTFAASAATMPLVANEITQTFFDLNSVSNSIVKFHRQNMPIRVFYSETANIVDAEQINRTFAMFESLFFEGIPIGFATKGIIDSYQDTFDQILIYNTPYVTDEEFNALQTYLDNGGTIVMDKSSLTMNQYKQARNKTLNESAGKLIIVESGKVADMRNKAFELLAADKIPTLKLDEYNGTDKKGCIWRTADGNTNNQKIISIVNVGKHTANLTLNGTNITNMLTGEKLTSTFQLESEGVLLLSVDVESEKAEKVSMTALQAEIEKAKTKLQSEYTEQSWATFAEALAKAEAVLSSNNVTQAEVNLAQVNLESAANKLVPIAKAPEESNNSKEPENPQTGDTGSVLIGGVVSMLSLGGIVTTAFLTQKRKKFTE